MNYLFSVFVITISLISFDATADGNSQNDNNQITLNLIKEWVGGTYDNRAQVETDISNDVPQDERFMPMHQIVTPVDVKAFDGLTYFSQLSNDGTTDTILGVGIYHYHIDAESGQVTMRLYMFNDVENYTNAHLDLAKLEAVTLDDVHSTEGCGFYLTLAEDKSHIKGEMKENSCYPISRSTGNKIQHLDELMIKPGELWNNARYYDLEGNQLFGNVTGEYAKQVRIDESL